MLLNLTPIPKLLVTFVGDVVNLIHAVLGLEPIEAVDLIELEDAVLEQSRMTKIAAMPTRLGCLSLAVCTRSGRVWDPSFNFIQYYIIMIKSTPIKIGVKIKPCPSQDNILTYKQTVKSYILSLRNNEELKQFEIDAIHDANTSKQTTFHSLQIDQFIVRFMKGFNVTIMAYGQTGAGKTFCMEGNKKQPGIIKEAMNMIYQNMDSSAQVKCSYFQLYNEKVYDLLNEESTLDDPLKLRWQVEKDFVVEDLQYEVALSASELEKVWKKGNKNRIVASNKIHQLSSRSHAIFTITLTDEDEQKNFRSRTIFFVDLAGSERMADKIGKLSKESIEINKSLFVLRKVIKALEASHLHKKQTYIPYRESKLTSLLKKSFGGNCLTMMIACIDGNVLQKQQTFSTLGYAISAGHIKNTASINIDQQALENKHLKRENEKLKKELDVAMKQIDILHRKEQKETEKKTMMEYSHKIIECIGTIRELIKSNKELREELDEERFFSKQQKVEIQTLMEENYNAKKIFEIPELPKSRFKPQEPSSNSFKLHTSIRRSKDQLKTNSTAIKKRYIFHQTQPDQLVIPPRRPNYDQ